MNIAVAVILMCLFGFVGFAIGAIIVTDRISSEYSKGTLYISSEEIYLELDDKDSLPKTNSAYIVLRTKHVK